MTRFAAFDARLSGRSCCHEYGDVPGPTVAIRPLLERSATAHGRARESFGGEVARSTGVPAARGSQNRIWVWARAGREVPQVSHWEEVTVWCAGGGRRETPS